MSSLRDDIMSAAEKRIAGGPESGRDSFWRDMQAVLDAKGNGLSNARNLKALSERQRLLKEAIQRETYERGEAMIEKVLLIGKK